MPLTTIISLHTARNMSTEGAKHSWHVLQFTGNTKGELSFLAFDTKGAVSAPSSYKAEACKFTVTLTLLPNALSSVSSDQLFPQADAADALPGSFLKVRTLLSFTGIPFLPLFTALDAPLREPPQPLCFAITIGEPRYWWHAGRVKTLSI